MTANIGVRVSLTQKQEAVHRAYSSVVKASTVP